MRCVYLINFFNDFSFSFVNLIHCFICLISALIVIITFYLVSFFFFFFINLFAAFGLRCCAWAFSSCGERGLLFVAVSGLLIAVASLCCGAQAVGTWAQ